MHLTIILPSFLVFGLQFNEGHFNSMKVIFVPILLINRMCLQAVPFHLTLKPNLQAYFTQILIAWYLYMTDKIRNGQGKNGYHYLYDFSERKCGPLYSCFLCHIVLCVCDGCMVLPQGYEPIMDYSISQHGGIGPAI